MTMIVSTGAMMCGALADFQLPHAVLRDILPSFQMMVAWYFHPTAMAIWVMSEDSGCLPFLFLSRDTFTHSRPVGRVQ